MFVNLSNHNSRLWSAAQRERALEWGEIVDYPFPDVDACGDEAYIAEMANRIAAEIANMHPLAVMCQGEFSLSYAVISRLKEKSILVVAACSRRVVEETVKDGRYEKKAVFVFERFRKY